MKKFISITLVLALAVSAAALAGCSNDGQSSASSSESSESATEAKKTETAKVSKFEAYLTYDPDEYTYDKEQLELFSKTNEDQYIYGEVYDSTEIDREKEQFDSRESNDKLKDVKYGEINLDNYTAKTVTYKSSGTNVKEYFIVFDNQIGDWAVGAKVFANIGKDLNDEAKVDAVVKTFEVKPQSKSDE